MAVFVNESTFDVHTLLNSGDAFSRLRLIAASLLRRERPGHTLQPTALVSELFLKLHSRPFRLSGDEHFYSLAARAMRQVLIDHARVKKAAKKIRPDSVPALLANRDDMDPAILLAVQTAFSQLEAHDALVASTAWLRAVEGLTLAELSQLQNREVWRVRADYDFALRWLAGRVGS